MLDCRWEDGTGGRPCMVIGVRVVRRERHRCPHCGRRGSGYDQGDGVRRWRVPDVGLSEAMIEANAPRMQCKEHGVLVARVPWARNSSGFSRAFAVEVLVCVHCAGKLRLVEIAGGGHGDKADHPRRTTKARGTRERNGSASAAARTAGAVDVRVSVRATEETLRDFARAKRPAARESAA